MKRVISTTFQGRFLTTSKGRRKVVLGRVYPKLGFFGRLVRL